MIDIEFEIKKMISLIRDNTYSDSDIRSHMIQILRESKDDVIKESALHKQRLEMLVFRIDHLKELKQEKWIRNKSNASKIKAEEKYIEDLGSKLLLQGYSIKHLKERAEQQGLFK